MFRARLVSWGGRYFGIQPSPTLSPFSSQSSTVLHSDQSSESESVKAGRNGVISLNPPTQVALPKADSITPLNRPEEPPLSPATHPRLSIGHRECRDTLGITSRHGINGSVGIRAGNRYRCSLQRLRVILIIDGHR